MEIDLILVETNVLIFDPEDCSNLRINHRIVGDLIGRFNCLPALPLQLMPEEVKLLQDKKIGRVAKYTQSNYNPEEFESNLLREERLAYLEIRRKELESRIDQIVAAKRKKGDVREKAEIMNDLLEKSSEIPSDKMIWPIPHTPIGASTEPVDFEPVIDQERYLIFKDLWEKEENYYITSGQKFGGDFLVYKGDPLIFRAIFIVKCVKATAALMPIEIIALGRLATSVKKRAVLASVIDNKVTYTTVNWIDD